MMREILEKYRICLSKFCMKKPQHFPLILRHPWRFPYNVVCIPIPCATCRNVLQHRTNYKPVRRRTRKKQTTFLLGSCCFHSGTWRLSSLTPQSKYSQEMVGKECNAANHKRSFSPKDKM